MLGLGQFLTRDGRVKAAAQRALEAEAAKLVEAIRDAAPADSGDLRDSVRQEPGDLPGTVDVKAGGTPETARQTAGGSFDVALLVEYGTARTEAQPFFHPTVERMRGSIGATITSALADAVEE